MLAREIDQTYSRTESSQFYGARKILIAILMHDFLRAYGHWVRAIARHENCPGGRPWGLTAEQPGSGVRGQLVTLSGPNQADCGRWAAPAPNPNDGRPAVHGSGTRQPSRLFSAPRDRA
jgi:hypothetical protein